MNAIMVLPKQETDIRKWITATLRGLGDAIFKADPFCDVDAPDWIVAGCGKERGGVIAVGLIKNGAAIGTTDAEIVAFLEDEQNWADGIAASPQTMWVIRPTRGSKPAGTPTEEPGFGLNSVSRNGDENELTFNAQGIMDNRDFVAAINRNQGWGFVYVTAGGSAAGGYNARYAPNTSIYMTEVLQEDIKTEAVWQGSAKWSTDGTPSLPFLAPASIFT